VTSVRKQEIIMGLFYKMGQYAIRFRNAVEVKIIDGVEQVDKNWKDAAKDEIKRLIGARGGKHGFQEDTRRFSKTLRQCFFSYYNCNYRNTEWLYQLYLAIDTNNKTKAYKQAQYIKERLLVDENPDPEVLALAHEIENYTIGEKNLTEVLAGKAILEKNERLSCRFS